MIAVVSQMVRCVILFLKIEKAPAQPGKNILFQAIILFQHARNSWEKRCFSQQDKNIYEKSQKIIARCRYALRDVFEGCWMSLDIAGGYEMSKNVAGCPLTRGRSQNIRWCRLMLMSFDIRHFKNLDIKHKISVNVAEFTVQWLFRNRYSTHFAMQLIVFILDYRGFVGVLAGSMRKKNE